MTAKGAICELQDIYNNALEYNDEFTKEAFDMAINALEHFTDSKCISCKYHKCSTWCDHGESWEEG